MHQRGSHKGNKSIEMNENHITTYQDLWDTGKISAEREFHSTKCLH